MNARFQESATPLPADFTVRQRRPSIQVVSGIFAGTFVVTLIISLALADNKMLATVLLAVAFVSFGWYLVSQMQLLQDLLLEAEFQNAIFASSLGVNQKFIAIVRNDNTITYFNRGFQDTFPKFLRQAQRSIDVLLDQCEVSPDERNKLVSAISKGLQEKIVFDMYGDIGPHKIIITVEPISKPSGFLLLRGRDFVEIRKQQVQVTPVLE